MYRYIFLSCVKTSLQNKNVWIYFLLFMWNRVNKNNSGGRFFYFVFFVYIWSSVKKDQMCRTTLKRWTWSGRKIPRDLFLFLFTFDEVKHILVCDTREKKIQCVETFQTFSSFVKQSRQFFLNIYSNYIFTVCNKVNMQFKCLIVSLVVLESNQAK